MNRVSRAGIGTVWIPSRMIALAQFESATLTGVVTDAAGAAIPAVAVKALNEMKGRTSIHRRMWWHSHSWLCFGHVS